MELQPLFDILAKVSDGRVLAAGDLKTEGDLHLLKIPVSQINPGDKTDQALRRFCADWIRRTVKEVHVEAKWEPLAGVSWYFPDREVPLVGALVISWWPRPPMSSMDEHLAIARARRRAADEDD